MVTLPHRTTLARMVAGLVPATQRPYPLSMGRFWTHLRLRQRTRGGTAGVFNMRRSLNSRMTVGSMLAEPLRLMAGVRRSRGPTASEEMLGLVCLSGARRAHLEPGPVAAEPDHRSPSEDSGKSAECPFCSWAMI